jgi:hypothetical protein
MRALAASSLRPRWGGLTRQLASETSSGSSGGKSRVSGEMQKHGEGAAVFWCQRQHTASVAARQQD